MAVRLGIPLIAWQTDDLPGAGFATAGAMEDAAEVE